MKKIAVLLAMLLMISLTACNNADNNVAVLPNDGDTSIADTTNETEDTTTVPEENEKNQATSEPDTDNSSVEAETSNSKSDDEINVGDETTNTETAGSEDITIDNPEDSTGSGDSTVTDNGNSETTEDNTVDNSNEITTTPEKPADTTKPEDKVEENKPAPHKHSYTSKVVAPTTSAQGYTEYTCSCGHSYKDNYTAKLEEPKNEDPKDWSNTGGANDGTNTGLTGRNAGQLIDNATLAEWGMTRPASRVNGGSWSTFNQFLFDTYGRRFILHGIGLNLDENGKFAAVSEKNGSFSVEVFGWRKSYSSDSATNACLNMVMEAFYYGCGDMNVAYALWSWVDAVAINGSANTDDYGFTDVTWGSNGGTVTMNGIDVDIDLSVDKIITVTFH